MIQALIELLKKDPVLSKVSQEEIEILAGKILRTLNNDFLKKQRAEINRIELDKWDEGIRKNHDPGDDFILQWIKNNGHEFHEQFQNSDCRICSKVYECKMAPKNACDVYAPELFDQSRYLASKLIRLLEERQLLTPRSKEFIGEFCKYYGIDDHPLEAGASE